ncbi:hypothetical protein [Streptomyces sp. NPDC090112]|uniref:glycoside hydrolase family 16 protein n=1 Tax=Streptomyces sp. NPDC090112 TaxID=3365949 RepID=UPI00382CA5FC
MVILVASAFLMDAAVPIHAPASPLINQVSLSPSAGIEEERISPTLRLKAPRCTVLDYVGISIKNASTGDIRFPGGARYVIVCPNGATISATPLFLERGTYEMSGFYVFKGNKHELPRQALTVSSQVVGNPAHHKGGLVFDENFNSLNWGARWNGEKSSSYEFGDRNPEDNKLDLLDRRQVHASNGLLSITAHQGREVLENGKRAWRTGLITTEGTREGFEARTGDYIETRVRLPQEIGAWPALWTWKSGGNEIDAFEYHPDNPNILELTNRVGRRGGKLHEDENAIAPGKWVTIGVHIDDSSTDWYVNGRRVHSDAAGTPANWSAYLILNLSVCAGTYHPAPQPETRIAFHVDYLRVWR